MTTADRIDALHALAMKEHLEKQRSRFRTLVGFFVFCFLAISSSVYLLWQPPPGFAPPTDFQISGHTSYLIFLLVGTVLGFTGLVVYAVVLIRRQVDVADGLMNVISILLAEQSGRSSN